MWEMSTVCVYSGLENGWTRYQQLAGSQHASTKRAEIERYLAACMAIMCTKIDTVGSGFWRALTRSKEPTNAILRYAVAVINRRDDH